MEILAALGRFGVFAGQVARRVAAPPWEGHEISRQIWLVFARCIGPVVAVVLPLGMVMALQALQVFELYGTQYMLSSMVAVAIWREISPVLASALVAAQAGSAFAAELGAMRIKEELDATEVMGVDSIRVHVVPRVLAAVVATPILNLAGSLGGVAGGWFTATVVKGEASGVYWAHVWGLTEPVDLLGSLLKTAVFGAIIGLVACYKGYYATGGAEGVGRAVNDTVVVAITAFVVANYFLTSALFGSLG